MTTRSTKFLDIDHPIQAILFDWAGTTVDYGSRAPTSVFIEIFRQRGVEITTAEARGPMGRAKHDRIAAVAYLPRVADLWAKKYGHAPTDKDIQAMYDDFLPLQKEFLARGCDIIPGVIEAVTDLCAMGLKIGSTTGYTRELMEVVAPLAAKGGYSPDVIISSDDVPAGRPAPWMNFRAAEHLGVYPMSSVIAVDDTPVGIEAGLNAGCWTVAISQTGNALGLSQTEVNALSPQDLTARLAAIDSEFKKVGAHFVLKSVAELPALVRSLGKGTP